MTGKNKLDKRTGNEVEKLWKGQSARTLLGSHDVHHVCLKSEREGEPNIVHGGASEHALNASAGKTGEGQKSCRTVLSAVAAALLSLPLTRPICSGLFDNVRLLLKTQLSDNIGIVLTKSS